MKRILLLIFLILIFLLGIRAQVPYGMSSFPSANPTVFLDFDGQTINSPYWVPFNGDSAVFCKPSQMTKSQMIRVFNQVSEDFRPFNINITTDSSVYFTAPLTRRTRVIITPTYKWYGLTGGVAYIESFRWGLDIPCFVFDSLFLGNDKRVAEATSHEIGHTLGLYHQARYNDTCKFLDEYNPGRGSGDIGWAPIMGNSYFRNLSIWHVGTNSLGCSSIQNDIKVIASNLNGVTLRVDDHGNSENTSTQVTMIDGSFNSSGVINDSLDSDLFKFDFKTPGRFTLKAVPYSPGLALDPQGNLSGVTNHSSNIDIEISLILDSKVIGVYNPQLTLNASIDTLLNPGVYYIKIKSKSNINISNTGMLGSYTIQGSFGGTVVVPIRYSKLSGTHHKGKHHLNWELVSDELVEIVRIEFSEDGVNFKNLITLDPNVRNYQYFPKNNENLYYRLFSKTTSQSIYYSETVLIRSIEKHKILSTTISDEIVINSKSNYDWILFDIGGKKILNGKIFIGTNRISTINLSPGLYLIRIFNSEESRSEKIIRLKL